VTGATLRRLQDWLTLHETATELSAALGETVADHDVLRLALDGHLKLSIYLPGKVSARCEWRLDPAIDPKQTVREIQGLCDVPIKGRAKLQIEHDYHWMFESRHVPIDGPVGAVVETGDLLCHLPPDRGETGFSTRSSSEFSRGFVYAVRRSALEEFIEHVAGTMAPAVTEGPAVSDRQLGERERATLLTIVAALARLAGVDVSRPTKAAESIEAASIELGARVSARSIEDHLKRIPDALERRGKQSS
jgi:hypothetical protein